MTAWNPPVTRVSVPVEVTEVTDLTPEAHATVVLLQCDPTAMADWLDGYRGLEPGERMERALALGARIRSYFAPERWERIWADSPEPYRATLAALLESRHLASER